MAHALQGLCERGAAFITVIRGHTFHGFLKEVINRGLEENIMLIRKLHVNKEGLTTENAVGEEEKPLKQKGKGKKK